MKPSYHRVTFFSRTTAGQIKIWSCWIEGDGITVTSSWGIKNGKMQMTRDMMTSRGKRGTRAYKSPKEVALEEHARQVLKKQRSGYVEAEARAASVRLEQLKTTLDFDHLPRAFAPAKPIREIAMAEAKRLEHLGVLAIQRKRDGMRHYIVKGTGGIRVFSRGMDDMTEHFRRLIQELDFPNGTILDAEFVVEKKGADNFQAVAEICRSKPERARRTMVTRELDGHDLRFLVFDLLFYDGLPVWKLPYGQRYKALEVALVKAHPPTRTRFNHVALMHTLKLSLQQAVDRVHTRGWEGLVLWRTDQATQVHLNRSPKRCNCYKFKPMREGDFIATGFERGKGRNQKVVGALNLSAYDRTGIRNSVHLISLGRVGTGFDDATRKAALKWKYPCVVEVQYEKISETGLRFPTFLRKRDDKKPRECVFVNP